LVVFSLIPPDKRYTRVMDYISSNDCLRAVGIILGKCLDILGEGAIGYTLRGDRWLNARGG